MAAAIFGLIGVLVGGALNFATTYYLQPRQDRSAVQSIARLAYDDCLHYQSTLVRALAESDWWPRNELMSTQVGDRSGARHAQSTEGRSRSWGSATNGAGNADLTTTGGR